MSKPPGILTETANLIKFILNVSGESILYKELRGNELKDSVSKQDQNNGLNKLLLQTASAKKLVHISNLSKENSLRHIDFSNQNIKAFLGLPVIGLNEDVVGIFYITFTKSTAISEDKINTLNQVLTQASHLFTNSERLQEFKLKNKILAQETLNQKKILQSTKAGTWILNIKTGETSFNERWAEIIGYTLDELRPVSYDTWKNLVHKEDIAQAEHKINAFIAKSSGSYSSDFRMQHKKGHYVWIHASGSIVDWTEDNEPLMMIGSHIDISAHKASEENVEQNKRQLEEVQRVAKIGSWSYNATRKTYRFSKEFIEIFGDTFQNTDNTVSDYILETDKPLVARAKKDCVTLGIPYEITYKILNANNDLCIIAEQGSAIKDSQGKIVSVYGTLHDVTEKKNEEERRKLLESVVTQTKDAIIITEAESSDESGPKIIYVNDAFTKMTGYSAEEVIGKTPKMLQGPKSNKSDLAKLNKAIRNYEAHETTAINYKKNGQPFWVNFSIAPITDENGNYTHWISIQRDVTKQKTEQQHLKLLESVVTNTSDSVLITEAEPLNLPGPKILYVNEAFTKMTGYTAEEVIGKTPRILQGPETNKSDIKKLGKALKKWETHEITTINYKKNGDPFWINFKVTPIADETGWYTHWVAIERDVTDEVNQINNQKLLKDISFYFTENETTKEALKASLKKLVEIKDFSYGEIWTTNKENHKMFLTTSCSSDDSGKKFKTSNKLEELKLEDVMQTEVVKGKKPIYWKNIQNVTYFTRKAIAKDAGLHSAMAIPLFANDEAQGVLFLMTKDTLKKSAIQFSLYEELQYFLGKEIKRKNLEIEFNQVFNFAPDIIVINNNKNIIIKANPAASKILGYTEEEIYSQSFYNFIHPEDREKTQVQTELLRSGKPVYNFENRYITKSGKVIWINWTATPEFRNGLTYSVGKDITAAKQNEEALKNLNIELKNYTSKLETSNSELEQFAYVASHDLQEPLRMVTSFLNQLKFKYEDTLDEKAHTYIHYAVDGAQRMRKIILDILEYSRLETEQEVPEAVNLNLVIEEILSYHRNDIDKNEAKVIYDDLPTIKIGKLAIFRIFNMIIGNALKYRSKDRLTVIEISAEEQDKHWQFAIADNGIGIPESYLEKIFVIFQRLHGKGEYPGTGIGLAIVKKLMQTNNGKVWVESEVNKGSTFYIQLPK